MTLKWGGTTITAVKWGSTNVTAVYWGSTKVWPTDAVGQLTSTWVGSEDLEVDSYTLTYGTIAYGKYDVDSYTIAEINGKNLHVYSKRYARSGDKNDSTRRGHCSLVTSSKVTCSGTVTFTGTLSSSTKTYVGIFYGSSTPVEDRRNTHYNGYTKIADVWSTSRGDITLSGSVTGTYYLRVAVTNKNTYGNYSNTLTVKSLST